MKKFFTIILLSTVIVYSNNDQKVVPLKKIDVPIKVDGIIDKEWDNKYLITLF